ncbi:uncharacterized protein LOC117315690 [Pecten maximus]|uniref:uncharacterized protein LOC117315690 n=1 Tax=Pecten maximus TaxID=6579 RepID=UPI001458BA15|nr:uncharacterized protein LOC117315690 [Pecten maximus]
MCIFGHIVEFLIAHWIFFCEMGVISLVTAIKNSFGVFALPSCMPVDSCHRTLTTNMPKRKPATGGSTNPTARKRKQSNMQSPAPPSGTVDVASSIVSSSVLPQSVAPPSVGPQNMVPSTVGPPIAAPTAIGPPSQTLNIVDLAAMVSKTVTEAVLTALQTANNSSAGSMSLGHQPAQPQQQHNSSGTVTVSVPSAALGAPDQVQATDSRVPEECSLDECPPNNSAAKVSATDLSRGIEELLSSSLAPSSKATYSKAWSTFVSFAASSGFKPDSVSVDSSHIALFISELHSRKFAPKTISTYVSAVAYVHKLLHNQDPTDSFLVKKLICGAHRIAPSSDTRLPFDNVLVDKMVSGLEFVTKTPFELVLFRAMFLFAFNAFARIGEIAKTGNQHNLVQFQNVHVSSSSSMTQEVVVNFYEFKHNTDKKRHTVSFSHGPTQYSAVTALTDYLVYRGQSHGPLFRYLNEKSVTRQHFDKILHAVLNYCNIDSRFYKGHSFRLGAASYAALHLHYSDAKIRTLGRWNSNAFKKYIRLPHAE